MKGAPWGGSEEFWYRLAIHMSRQGYKVDCCFFDWQQGKDEKKLALAQSGCILHLLPNPAGAKNYLHKLLIKSRIKKQLTRLVKPAYDMVCISQGGLVDVTYPMFNSMLPYLKKFVLLYHNYNDAQILSPSRKRSLYKWSQAASQNMAAAEKIFSTVQKIAGFQLTHQHVLTNPLTIPVQLHPCAWPPLNKNGNYVFIVIAQLDVERKAQDLLLKTLAAEKWKQRNWQLHIYGKGQDKELLSNLIISLNLQQKVLMKGHTSNVEEVLRQAHLLLQITHFDAMPISVTEAMSMARPCIVSTAGDMPLWIKEEEQGYVVPAVTQTDIDTVLEKAWQQKETWQQLGINAFKMFHNKYPHPYGPYYENFFASLIKG